MGIHRAAPWWYQVKRAAAAVGRCQHCTLRSEVVGELGLVAEFYVTVTGSGDVGRITRELRLCRRCAGWVSERPRLKALECDRFFHAERAA